MLNDAKLIDYDKSMYLDGRYMGQRWSEDQKDSMSLYLLEGIKPGGHMEAMLARDYERALFNADIHSRTVFWATAMWIRENVPDAAQGSYGAIEAWCKDSKARAMFRAELEKLQAWNILSNT